jgi:hypothetical protein
MLFKYRNSKTGIYGTFDIDEDGSLVDYNLTVPDLIPIMPAEVQLSNLHTVYLKNRGLNELHPKQEVTVVPEPEYVPLSKYELVKYIINE